MINYLRGLGTKLVQTDSGAKLFSHISRGYKQEVCIIPRVTCLMHLCQRMMTTHAESIKFRSAAGTDVHDTQHWTRKRTSKLLKYQRTTNTTVIDCTSFYEVRVTMYTFSEFMIVMGRYPLVKIWMHEYWPDQNVQEFPQPTSIEIEWTGTGTVASDVFWETLCTLGTSDSCCVKSTSFFNNSYAYTKF